MILGNEGLKISEPGVDVLTATLAELRFDASDRSVPLLIRGTVQLPTAHYVVGTIPYGRTFDRTPPSTLLWSPGHPSTAGNFTILSAVGTSTMWVSGLTGFGSKGDNQYLYWRRFADRVEVLQGKGTSAGTPAPLLTGWITALVFDYGTA